MSLEITENELHTLVFQSFRKSALVRARPLTEDDYQRKHGSVQTLEGVTTFQPGDYLAHGIRNEEWPISHEQFAFHYEAVSQPDEEGYTLYRAKDIRQAYRIPRDFTVKRSNGDTLTGKAGDYLVRYGDRTWITEHTIFECTHEPV
jgi:PGDYG protein